jgi:hypothetical protein
MDQVSLVGRVTVTQEDIDDASQVIAALEEHGATVSDASWYFVSSIGAWRLVIATDMYEREGPRATYRLIQRALDQAPANRLTLSDVSIVPPDDALVKALRSTGIHHQRFGTLRFSRPMGEEQEGVFYRLR